MNLFEADSSMKDEITVPTRELRTKGIQSLTCGNIYMKRIFLGQKLLQMSSL
jgi:hypothetical protein